MEFADKFKAAGIVYEHRLIDDMVASALKWAAAMSEPAKIMTATCSPAPWRRALAHWAS
jgi:hypothetical protein